VYNGLFKKCLAVKQTNPEVPKWNVTTSWPVAFRLQGRRSSISIITAKVLGLKKRAQTQSPHLQMTLQEVKSIVTLDVTTAKFFQ